MRMDREKVIKGLECCRGYCDEFSGCPYFAFTDDIPDCEDRLKDDAIALLKEQETGVLDLDELFIYERLVYVEVKARADWPWAALVSYWYPDSTEIEDDKKDEEPDPYIVFVDSDADMYDFLIREYGVTWRCWDALTSRTEMKETPWKEASDK